LQQLGLAALGLDGHLAVFADAAEQALAQTQTSDAEMLKASTPSRRCARPWMARRSCAAWKRASGRERGFDGDAGGLVVADFTDEDDVRVHAEVAAERARKREADGPVSSASG